MKRGQNYLISSANQVGNGKLEFNLIVELKRVQMSAFDFWLSKCCAQSTNSCLEFSISMSFVIIGASVVCGLRGATY